MVSVKVTEFPFNAKGDGITNDREAIQSAIDYVYSNGGGTVTLDENKTFLSSGIVIKSNVNLHFGNNSVLKQIKGTEGYYKPSGDGYVAYIPSQGHNFSPEIKWSHNWYRNYPFIFATEGSRNFKITGNGTVSMCDVEEGEKESFVRLCPVGFFRCSDFEISDIHITNYHSYAMMPFTSRNGLIKNVKIDKWCFGNGDGICLMNCQSIRITGCKMFTGDDSVYIFSSYRDPRRSEWWNSDKPQTSENIEIDHNDLISNHCKAFGMILWGIDCPDLEDIEVRNISIHDNHFETMGNWLWNPYSDKGIDPPVTSVHFENNVIDGIEANFFETKISDMNYFASMSELKNGNFDDGRCWWAINKNSSDDSVKVIHKTEDESGYGMITDFDKGDCSLYQGLYFRKETDIFFRAQISGNGRLFVRSKDTDELVASADFENKDEVLTEMTFTVPKDGNYKIGIERGYAKSGFAKIKDARLGNFYAPGNAKIITDRGKIIYKYNDNLFKR